MSGVFGIVGERAVRESASAMQRMLAAAEHRGPDGSGLREFPGAALGHLRLDVAMPGLEAQQPFVSSTGRCIVLDADLHETDELVSDLERETGRSLGECSFAEAFLHAFEIWGSDCLDRIEGTFAVAIWDPEAHRLFCARDRIGVRPFFFAEWNGGFAFASEIGQLLALPGMDRAPDESTIADYLVTDPDLSARTFFRQIRRLPGGSFAWVDAQGRSTVQGYWDLDPGCTLDLDDDRAYGDRFRELLQRSVRNHMQAGATLGSNLSGGLDSSSIVCIADALRREQGIDAALHTFSLAFDDRQVSEEEHVQAVCAVTNIHHHHYRAEAENLFAHLSVVQRRQAEPFRSLGVALFWRLKEIAAGDGMRVLLNGMGADEILGGINLYYVADLLREGRWIELRRTLRELVAHDPFAFRFSGFQYLKTFGLRPLLPPGLLRVRGALRGGGAPPFLEPGFARRIDAEARVYQRRPRRFPDTYRQLAYEGLRNIYTPMLMHYEDANNAGFGIESRFPFLDRKLVEFMFACPREQKMRAGVAKIVLRNGLRGVLPDSVRNRVDKGFIDNPVDHWLGHQYRDVVQRVFEGRALRECGWIDVGEVRRCYEMYRRGEYSRILVWKVFNLGLWLEETGA